MDLRIECKKKVKISTNICGKLSSIIGARYTVSLQREFLNTAESNGILMNIVVI